MTLILCGCSHVQEDIDNNKNISSLKGENIAGVRKESVLESFCEFYGGLLEEGREEELEPYVISRILSEEEADEVGKKHEEVSYFRGFKEGEHNAESVIVLEADFDNDGSMDILEYDLDNGENHSVCSLTIYRMEDSEFVMKYSQPKFGRMGYYANHRVSVVRFNGETFLLIEAARDDVMSIETDIYWLRDWELTGKCSVSGGASRETVNLEYVLASKEGYRPLAEKICREAPVITHGGENSIVSVSGVLTVEKSDIGGHFWGSAEEGLAESVIRGEADMAQISFVERYDGNSGITRETLREPDDPWDYETVNMFWTFNGQMFQSDINNDGKMEMYVKDGRKNGLYYYMESEGQVVDFEDLCGLDIQGQRFIPKMFWVEEVDRRNITFFLYQSADRRDFEIAGYDIQDKEYTEILKVEGHADVECRYEYEWKKEGESGSLPYGVRMAYDDIEHVVLYGMQNEEKQECINQRIEELLRQEIESGSLKEHYAEKEGFAGYTLYRAEQDEIVVEYEYIWFNDEADKYYGENYCFLIDVSNGSCIETGYWGFEENVW